MRKNHEISNRNTTGYPRFFRCDFGILWFVILWFSQNHKITKSPPEITLLYWYSIFSFSCYSGFSLHRTRTPHAVGCGSSGVHLYPLLTVSWIFIFWISSIYLFDFAESRSLSLICHSYFQQGRAMALSSLDKTEGRVDGKANPNAESLQSLMTYDETFVEPPKSKCIIPHRHWTYLTWLEICR